MLITRGAPALSTFRIQKLQQLLSSEVKGIEGINAEYVHFSELSSDLSKEQVSLLEKLLEYGPQAAAVNTQGQLLLVVPRPGTISPWSSKATDIAHNAGLTNVVRVERGIAYYINTDKPLKAEQLDDVKADRKSVV